jgi:glycerophosphoryl diester phosphodiesterase
MLNGADILEFDVRMTKDHVLVVIHDAWLIRTHRHTGSVSNLTFDELLSASKDNPIPTLKEVLDIYYKKILLNIEIKSRGTGAAVVELLKSRYIKKSSDWDNILISSFKGSTLTKVRKESPHANLALLHSENPFIFIAYHRRLSLTAVGFHRLYLNRFALEIAQRLQLFTYVYTVDRTAAIPLLQQQNIDGIVTNYPDKFRAYIVAHAEDD